MVSHTQGRQSSIIHTILLIIALTCLTLLAVQPYLSGDFPQTADGNLHLYRLVAFDYSVQHDALWPRYASGMVYGYGAPLFNYYAPAAMYPQEAMHLLGFSFVDAFRMSMVLYAAVGTIGAYLLGKVWGGAIAGVVTAAAYTYAPYMLFDSIWRGTVPEFAALALLPAVLWGFTTVAQSGRRKDITISVILYALFIPLHNITTLYSAGLIILYCGLLWWLSDNRRCVFIRLALTFAFGLALTAFFWLPAVTETEYVKIDAVTENLPFIDVIANLQPLSDSLRLPLTADPTQMQFPVPVSISWIQVIVTVIGLILARHYGTKGQKALLLFGLVLVPLFLFMLTPASAAIWRIVPLIRYSQFPWRWLGLATLLLALMAGIGTALVANRLPNNRWRLGWMTIALVLIVLYAVPWIYTITIPTPQAETIADYHTFERQTGQLATSSYNEYLPFWTQADLNPDALTDRFAQSDIIPRLTPPEGVSINSAEWGGTWGWLTLTVDAPTDLTFDWLYLPGWIATLDGQPLEVVPTQPQGFVSVSVPEGSYTLDIRLGMTDTQSLATGISIVGVILFVGLMVAGKRLSIMKGEHIGLPLHSMDNVEAITNQTVRLQPTVLLLIAITGLALFAVKALIIDTIQSPFKSERFANGITAGVQIPLEANFANQFVLIGADVTDSVSSGGETTINLYWRLYNEAVAADYSSVIHLRNEAGTVVGEYGAFQPGGLATSNWQPGYYIQEQVNIAIPSHLPPGTYTLDAGLYLPDTQARLDVINAAGNPEGVRVVIGTIIITRPDTLTDSPRSEPNFAVTLQNTLSNEATVGQELTIVFRWQTDVAPNSNYRFRLAWIDEDDNPAAYTPDFPLTAGYPTSAWGAGDSWDGYHIVYVPGSLEMGNYRVVIEWLDDSGTVIASSDTMANMHITTPERSFDVPDTIQNPTNLTWDNGIQLLGYDVTVGEGLTITLYWQPQSQINTNLRYFVHVIDTDTRIIAIQDGIPLNWTRPTTGWSPGEVLTDTFTLTVPPGDYLLRIGWYDPLTNTRVTLPDGSDTAVLGAMEVE